VTFSDLNTVANPYKMRSQVDAAAGRPLDPRLANADIPDVEDAGSMSGSSSGSAGSNGSGSDDEPDAAGGGAGMGGFLGLGGGSTHQQDSPPVSPLDGPASEKKGPKKGSSWDRWLSEPPLTPADKIQAERERKERSLKKAKLMAKFDRKNVHRKPGNKIEYNPAMTLEELEAIDERESYGKQSELNVKIMRRVLVFFCQFVEGASKKFPKLGLELEGWAESVYLTLETYDDILFDIHDEYCSGVKMNPIAQLFIQLTTNAIMYSMAKKLMSSSAMSHLATEFKRAAESAQQQQQQPQQPQATPAAGAAPSNPMAGISQMLGSLFGGGGGGGHGGFGAATMGAGDEDLGAPDLNSLFSTFGQMFNPNNRGGIAAGTPTATQQQPKQQTGIPDAAVGPVDIRDRDLPMSTAPTPMQRAPHVNDLPPPPDMSRIGGGGGGGGGAVLIRVLREQEDIANHNRNTLTPGGLPRIVEVTEEEEGPDVPDPELSGSSRSDETKSISIPDAPVRRGGAGGGGGGAGTAGGSRGRNRVHINDIPSGLPAPVVPPIAG
jgi:hypothetical protein